jgi:Surface adhesin CshA repetitive domain
LGGEDDDNDSFDEDDVTVGSTKLKVLKDPSAAAKASAKASQAELGKSGVLKATAGNNGAKPKAPRVFVAAEANPDYGRWETGTNLRGASGRGVKSGPPGYDPTDMPLDQPTSSSSSSGYAKSPPPANVDSAVIISSVSDVRGADEYDDTSAVSSGQQQPQSQPVTNTVAATTATTASERVVTCKRVIVALVAIAVVATVITLSVVFGTRGSEPVPSKAKPVVKAQKKSFAKPGKSDSVAVLEGATAPASAALNRASLEIATMKGMTAMQFAKTLTVTGEGKWDVDGKGNVSFTPEAGLAANPSPILFRVSDNQSPPQVSDAAGLTLTYETFPQPVTEPVAQKISVTGQTQGATVKIDVAAKAVPSAGNTIDKTSVKIISAVQSERVLEVLGQGSWLAADDGTISFVPDKALAKNPNPIAYSIADSSGKRSKSATIEVGYAGFGAYLAPPFASAIDVTGIVVPKTATGAPIQIAPMRISLGPYVMAGDNAVDTGSVVLINTQTPIGLSSAGLASYGSPVTKNGVTLGYTKITVQDQGVWTVEADPKDAAQRQIVFTPDPGAIDFPTSVTYSIADTTGAYSIPARITLFAGLEQLVEASKALAAKSDADFWSGLTTELKSVTDIDEAAIVIIMLEALTRSALGATADAVDMVGKTAITGRTVGLALSAFLKAGSTPDKLMDLGATTVTDAVTGLGGMPLATRYLRLSFMRRIYREYLAQLVQTMQGGAG